MNVAHFQRRPTATGNNFSVERIFSDVRAALPPAIACTVNVCRHQRGVAGRILNMLHAAFEQGDVNHIVGDVHYLTLPLRKNRTILTILDCVGLTDPRTLHRIVRKYLWYVIPARRAAVITVISHATRAELLREIGVAPSKVRVIPACVSPSFTPAPKTFDPADYRILQVGTARNKNLPRLVEAVRGLPCHLRIIGRLDAEQARCLEASGVRYSVASNLTDAEMVAEYRDCDLVAFVSTYEGFGLPILEGQATGRPVVTSRLLSMPEVAGEGACLVDPLHVAAIRSGIERIASDRDYRSQLVARGFTNVKRYTHDAVAAMYAQLYQHVLDGTLESRTRSREVPGAAGATAV